MADNTIIPMNQFPQTFQQFYTETYRDDPGVFIRDIVPANFIDVREQSRLLAVLIASLMLIYVSGER
jgi:hypothetical protein